MKKGDYPGDELCLAQRKNDPGPCRNRRNECTRHCNSALRKKAGERCARYPMANGRCRIHGGKAVRGVEHPRFRTGETSRYFPRGDLVQQYNEAHTKGVYTELRDEIALTTGMINELLSESGGVTSEKQRSEAMRLMDHRRKLVDSEAKRLEREMQTLTLEQVMMRDAIFMEVLRELLVDSQLVHFRSRLAERLHVK